MPRKVLIVTAIAVALVSSLFIAQNVGIAGPPGAATMQYGLANVGSPFQQPPTFPHDNSERATDTILPGSVAISAGGAVDFLVSGGFHEVAIYEPGKDPKDVNIIVPPGPPLIDDPDGRIMRGGLRNDVSFTFDEPGKYLVICTVAGHFTEGRMWGWVQVK